MFARLARFIIRHRRPVLIAAGVFFVVAGALGGTVADHLSRGGFDDPRAESVTARRRLEREFGAGLPAYVLVVTPTRGRSTTRLSPTGLAASPPIWPGNRAWPTPSPGGRPAPPTRGARGTGGRWWPS